MTRQTSRVSGPGAVKAPEPGSATAAAKTAFPGFARTAGTVARYWQTKDERFVLFRSRSAQYWHVRELLDPATGDAKHRYDLGGFTLAEVKGKVRCREYLPSAGT